MSSPEPTLRLARTVCASLPEANEAVQFGHPVFRVRHTPFLAFETVQKRPSVAFRLGKTEAARLIGRGNAFATPYGRGVWASLWVDTPLPAREVERLTIEAYRLAAGTRLCAILDERLGLPVTPTRRARTTSTATRRARR